MGRSTCLGSAEVLQMHGGGGYTNWVRLTDCSLGNTAQGLRLEQPVQDPGSVSSATHILMGLVSCILS